LYQDTEDRVKKADEIEEMVKRLNPTNQLRVLSAVNALLYSQQVQREKTLKNDLQGVEL
jgi:hypothetical protein